MDQPDSGIFDRLRQTEDALGPCVVISLTDTMMKKAIIDAVEPLRNILKNTGVHDYETQKQGPSNRAFVGAEILICGESLQAKTSLYRPETKQGDPRFWVYGLNKICSPGDRVAVTVGRDQRLVVVVLRAKDWARTNDLLQRHRDTTGVLPETAAVSSHLEELISRLIRLAGGPPLPALVVGDTAVGRTLEHALDIQMNSSKAPDYKGIELKSARHRPAARKNRSTLFAQVPNWKISPLKSSREILDTFGYQRDGAFKFYCEVGSKPNSLGVFLKHDPITNRIEERSTRADLPVVARWDMSMLEKRLLEKHNETAWIDVETTRREGMEFFRPIRVLYTSAPRVDVFPLLVDSGRITLDHLIKRLGTRVSEKGPLWKIEPGDHDQLFHETRTISLVASQGQQLP